MAAKLLRAFDVASSDAREQIILGIAERLSDDELQCFQTALQRLERRFDVLCGVSKSSGANLPHEIQLQIVDLLDITDIYYCTNVCRRWRGLLLQCEQLTDDLLKKFTCGFLKGSDGIFPVDRVEGLQRGRTFQDLTCSASRHIPPPVSATARIEALRQAGPASRLGFPTSGPTVSKYLYADGRLAWQLSPAPGEWVNSILVHDFHAHRRWDLSLPSMRTQGIKLALWALGRDLVVARVVGERVLYAWDLTSHAFDRVTLQNPPHRCFTRYRSVVVVTQSGELLLWSFGHGLANIDVAMPQDEGEYRGPAKPERTPREPLSAYEIQNSRVMFHPRDEDVFFMATFNERAFDPDIFLLLWVCEFRNKRCCRIFTYRVPPDRRHWIVFGAHRVDAHGTYQLLEQENHLDGGVQVSGVTFNTISKSFGDLRFEAPMNANRDISLVWNNHLVLGQASPEKLRVRPCPLVALGRPPNPRGRGAGSDIVFKSQTPERALESVMTSVSPELIDKNAPRAAIEASEQGNPKYDVIRAPDVSPSTSCIGAGIGLRYMLSFFGGHCNWEGFHARDCPRSSGLQPSDGHLYPINYFAQDDLSGDWGGHSLAIFGDDDFLVVVNSKKYYTVFAVDEYGKIAGTIRDGVSDNAEGMSQEAPQVTGS
ncbi:hypothetical protein INS49_011081 [Diaporthe citri]|uniref:uncharacterized protein n=1 Tax=Diaporthe citri TaxID=83186 RepID=UPI001C81385E|nr:uncharacterized protein INS49_011081 [Diaporthe citri]KAG6360025.1 hypothetical protein INS49_011081 [Diaporthe citri]